MNPLIHQKNILPLCLLLAPLIGLGMDLYTPSLPAITQYFHVSPYAAKLTIILYLAGFGISQPILGIISDHVSRRFFVLAALVGYIFSSLLSVTAPSIEFFYVCRIINSICATAIAILIKSVILDNFEGKMLAKANNYFTLSWSITPMIAPVIGGYLQHYFDWQANFYFMAVYGFIGLLYGLKLFDSHAKNSLKKVFSISTIFQKYKILFLDKIYISAIFILAIENVILFLYYTEAPFVIQKTLLFTSVQYGHVMLFSGLSYLFGNLINDRLLNNFECEKLIFSGLILSIIISLVPILIILFEKNNILNIYIFTLPIFLIFMCDGLIFPNLMTKALESYAAFSGIAGGLLAGGLNILAAMIVAICAHFINLHSVITLYGVYFVMLIISGIVFYKIYHHFINTRSKIASKMM